MEYLRVFWDETEPLVRWGANFVLALLTVFGIGLVYVLVAIYQLGVLWWVAFVVAFTGASCLLVYKIGERAWYQESHVHVHPRLNLLHPQEEEDGTTWWIELGLGRSHRNPIRELNFRIRLELADKTDPSTTKEILVGEAWESTKTGQDTNPLLSEDGEPLYIPVVVYEKGADVATIRHRGVGSVTPVPLKPDRDYELLVTLLAVSGQELGKRLLTLKKPSDTKTCQVSQR